jgi:GDP-mannose transporter
MRSLSVISGDGLTCGGAWVFSPYVAAFAASLYSNGTALKYVNMETLIVFLVNAPLFVSVLDWLWLGRELPSVRSIAAMLGVVLGAFGYVQVEGNLMLYGPFAYVWATVCVLLLSFQIAYGKKLLSGIKFIDPVWGATWYSNLLSLPPVALMALQAGELQTVCGLELDSSVCFFILVTGIIGTAVSWTGWNCLERTSAASFTLVGVICRFAGLPLSSVSFDKPPSAFAVFWLLACMVASCLYREAPLRKSKDDPMDEPMLDPRELYSYPASAAAGSATALDSGTAASLGSGREIEDGIEACIIEPCLEDEGWLLEGPDDGGWFPLRGGHY